MPSEAASISDSTTSSCAFAPRSQVESESNRSSVADLKTCSEKTIDWRRFVMDTREQWYALGVVRLSSSESTRQNGVRISTIVWEVEVGYVPDSAAPREVSGPSNKHSSPWEGKKCPVNRRRFEISSPPVTPRKKVVVDDPFFAPALAYQHPRGKSHRNGRNRKAAPVFQVRLL